MRSSPAGPSRCDKSLKWSPVVSFHTRLSCHFSNAISPIKVLTLLSVSITRLVVLCGHISTSPNRVPTPTSSSALPSPAPGYSEINWGSPLRSVLGRYQGSLRRLGRCRNDLVKYSWCAGTHPTTKRASHCTMRVKVYVKSSCVAL